MAKRLPTPPTPPTTQGTRILRSLQALIEADPVDQEHAASKFVDLLHVEAMVRDHLDEVLRRAADESRVSFLTLAQKSALSKSAVQKRVEKARVVAGIPRDQAVAG